MDTSKHIVESSVKVSPERFTWMKYKGTVSRRLRHTKRNGDIVTAKLDTNDVFGYRNVTQRSTGKKLIQVVLKSNKMDLTYNLLPKSFSSSILKHSKPTVMPKIFRKDIDVKATDKAPKDTESKNVSPYFVKTLRMLERKDPDFIKALKEISSRFKFDVINQHDVTSLMDLAKRLDVTPLQLAENILSQNGTDLKSILENILSEDNEWKVLQGDGDLIDLGDGYKYKIVAEGRGFEGLFVSPSSLKNAHIVMWKLNLEDLKRQAQETKDVHQGNTFLNRRWESRWGTVLNVELESAPNIGEVGSEMYSVSYADGSKRNFYGRQLESEIERQQLESTPEWIEQDRIEKEKRSRALEKSKELKAHNEKILNAIKSRIESWLSNTTYTSLQKGRILKSLTERVNYSGTVNGVLSREEFVRHMIVDLKAQINIREEPKYKRPSRQRYNRMSGDEQDEMERKIREGGTKEIYSIGNYYVTKIEYLYAQYLQTLKD